MNNQLNEIVEEYYSSITIETLKLRETFQLVFEYFYNFHNKKLNEEEYGTLFCNIHSYLGDEHNHNCVACNLQDSNRKIENFLFGYKYFVDINTTMTCFILLLYIHTECLFEYLKILKLPESYIADKFHQLKSIKKWANFLKHPKAFMLVHHPDIRYTTNEIYSDQGQNSQHIKIDDNFVQKYYSGGEKNKELYATLSNQQNVIVTYPNPLDLIKNFCKEQQEFTNLITNNAIVREILNNTATIAEYYENEEIQ